MSSYQGFKIEQDGKTYRYGVLPEARPGRGHFIHYYPDGGVGIADRDPRVSVFDMGPGTFGDSAAYYNGPLESIERDS